MLIMSCRSASRAVSSRKGTAAVELALCMTFLLVMALGSIEATNAIFLKQRLTAAAYEGARKATTLGQTGVAGTTSAQSVLTQFGIVGGTVSITPNIAGTMSTGTQVSVNVKAPLSSNTCITAYIIGKAISNVGATVVMDHQ